jgi:hypothetical protein
MTEVFGKKPFVPAYFESEQWSIAVREMARIVNSLPFFPRDQADDSVEGYREFSYEDPYYRPDVTGLSDGIAVKWATDQGLGCRAHRLTISDRGEMSYHRTSFDTDSQAVPSPDVHLSGFDDVSQNTDAIFGLLYTPVPELRSESEKRGRA